MRKKISDLILLIALAIYPFLYVFDVIQGMLPLNVERYVCAFIFVMTIIYVVLNISKFKKNNYLYLFLLYLVYIGLQTFNTDKEVFIFFISKILLTICLVILCLSTGTDDSNKKKSIYFSEIIMVALALIVDVLSIKNLNMHNPGGITINQNYLGFLNSISAIICLNYVIRTKSGKINRVIGILLAIILLYFMIRSECRSALLAVIVYVLMFVPNIYKKNKKMFLIGGGICLLVSLVFIKKILFFVFTVTSFDPETFIGIFTSGRDDIWFRAFPHFFKTNWLFGNGIMALQNVCFDNMIFIEEKVVYSTISYCHNIFLDILNNGGFVGTILLISGIVPIVKEIRKRSIKNNVVIKTALFTIAGILVAMIFDNMFIWGYFYTNLLMFLELGNIICETKKTEVANDEK